MSDMEEALLIPCPSCGATNRVPRYKVNKGVEAVCGRCKTPLPISFEPVIATDANFISMVERSPLPVLLDLWAAWRRPCRMIAPIIDQLAEELAGRVRVAKLNTDDNPMTAARFNVRSIPTLLLLRNGREIDRIVGVQSKAEIVRRLQFAIDKPSTSWAK
jgi:thioredoxin 2